MQSASAQKKRQEEKNSKTLRELAALPSNRNCFECGQRGPTYVNITEGSFCCTSCSGILRGLNPPHRVKSISMATFTNEEIEKLRTLGNLENAKTWLGLYGGSPPTMTNREDIQTFILKKYEQKAWYVSASELAEQERLMLKAKEIASQGASSTSSRSSKPPELDLFSSDPFSSVGSSAPIPVKTNSTTMDGMYNAAVGTSPQPFSPPACRAPPPPLPPQFQPQSQLPSLGFGPPANALPPKAAALQPFDMFGTVATDVAAPAPVSSSTFGAKDIFADFDNKFNDLTIKSSNTIDAFGSAVQPIPLIKSATISGLDSNPSQHRNVANNPFENITCIPNVPQKAPEVKPNPQPEPPKHTSNEDKYSALAELDQLFHSNPGQGEGKPAWMPSGFSTGLPPSTYAPAFPDPKPAFPDPKPAFPDSKPCFPDPKAAFPDNRPLAQPPTGNTFGSIPKSSTMGAITDFGMNNPFFTPMPAQYHANSQVNLNSNPFSTPQASFGAAAQSFPSGYTQPMNNWANPFGATEPSNVVPTSATQTANVNWNPFL